MSTPSLLNIPYLYKAGTLYSQIPESGAGDFTVTRATTPTAGRSTRINKDGLIELVADNVPRLDYPLGGAVNGCPALLVEPSAQNITTNSAVISGTLTGASIDANVAVSPDGTTTADKLKEDSNPGNHSLAAIVGGALGGTVDSSPYRISIFAKADGRTQFTFFDNNQSGAGAGVSTFDLSSGTATGTGVIQNYGNGWYRCIISCAKTALTSANALVRLLDAGGNSSYTGNGTSGILFWGKQLELGSVATSYIPTTTAAVTRGADVISRTSASALIGQSEGTIYAEVVLSRVNANQIISLGSANDRIAIFFDSSTGIYALIRVGGAPSDYNATIPAIPATGGVYKIALAYKANDYCFAVNGVAYNPSTASRGVPANMSAVYLGASVFSTGQLNDRIRAVAIYPNRLTNTQLATLTAP